MVEKIKKVLDEIKDHKTVAATTFTRKATQEIRKKCRELGGEKTFLVTTNDSLLSKKLLGLLLMMHIEHKKLNGMK